MAVGVMTIPSILAVDDEDLRWHENALCAQIGGDEWFPEKGGSTQEAKRICDACPVRGECLDYALTNGERYGIWGGKSERERRAMNTAGNGPGAHPCPDCGYSSATKRGLSAHRTRTHGPTGRTA